MTMHDLYDNARQLFGTRGLSWIDCAPRLQLIGIGYTPDPTHRNLVEIPVPAKVGAAFPLINPSMDRGIARADTVTVGPSYSGLYVTAGLIYGAGIDDATSILIAFYSNVLGLPSAIPSGGTVWVWDAINGAFKV